MQNVALAREWIADRRDKEFRFALVVFDTEEARRVARRCAPKREAMQEEVRPALHKCYSTIYEQLRGRETTILDQRRQIEAVGLSSFIKIAESHEELLNHISDFLAAGANTWSNGPRYAWQPDGVCVDVFWHDPSHGSP